jgi:hypothetical protein
MRDILYKHINLIYLSDYPIFLNCPLSTLNLDKDDLENADKFHFTINSNLAKEKLLLHSSKLNEELKRNKK